MKVAEIVMKDKDKITKKEWNYMLSVDLLKTTRLQKEDEIIELGEFADGSYTKTIHTEENNWEGDEVASSKEEHDNLINSGKYNIEVNDYED
jgi:hypothetical protein